MFPKKRTDSRFYFFLSAPHFFLKISTIFFFPMLLYFPLPIKSSKAKFHCAASRSGGTFGGSQTALAGGAQWWASFPAWATRWGWKTSSKFLNLYINICKEAGFEKQPTNMKPTILKQKNEHFETIKTQQKIWSFSFFPWQVSETAREVASIIVTAWITYLSIFKQFYSRFVNLKEE